jgi:alkanesulfonate monooxygenase SsuD/methylene tetrahydromethanopterin reductase-like flavin-dependent oxidoreductase (luciferase family)
MSDLYEQRLQIVEQYDRAGFYAYHVADHHSTPLGMAPSPSVVLSAVAQRTKALRFGPLCGPNRLNRLLLNVEGASRRPRANFGDTQ